MQVAHKRLAEAPDGGEIPPTTVPPTTVPATTTAAPVPPAGREETGASAAAPPAVPPPAPPSVAASQVQPQAEAPPQPYVSPQTAFMQEQYQASMQDRSQYRSTEPTGM